MVQLAQGSCAQWFGRSSSHNKVTSVLRLQDNHRGPSNTVSARSIVFCSPSTHATEASLPPECLLRAARRYIDVPKSRSELPNPPKLPSTCPSSKLQFSPGTRPSTESVYVWQPSLCPSRRRPYLQCPAVVCPSPTSRIPPTRRYASLPWAGRDSGLMPASNAMSPMASLPRRSRWSRSMMLRVAVMDSDDEAPLLLPCKRSSKPPERARPCPSRLKNLSEDSTRTSRRSDNGRSTTARCSLHSCSTLRASPTR